MECCISEAKPQAMPTEVRSSSVQCLTNGQLHRMAYTEWGDSANRRVLVCVHGLTRNGRDFDVLARALGKYYRVICPDVAGRGKSDWLNDKGAYVVPCYVGHMITLLARLDVAQVDWLGTSMGGLIGMVLASMPSSPIRCLTLNDVGPVLPESALRRISEYVGLAPVFANEAVAEAYLRRICGGFGALTDTQWRHLTTHSLRCDPDGMRMGYDPSIGDVMRSELIKADVEMWDTYDRIHCPTLVIHGMESDLLLPHVVAEMAQRGPLAQCIHIANTGHAPMLMDIDQIERVHAFLEEVDV